MRMSSMTSDVKHQIQQLLKINQALMADLDMSNRISAQIGSERDQLKHELQCITHERDELRMQLHESLVALKEIHLCLKASMPDMGL